MNRWTKILLAVGIAIVILAAVTVLIAKVVFTEERILATITPRLESTLNRSVHIGRAGISLSGGIGVWVGDVVIGNAEGFSDEPLLALHRFDFKARFWPLLLGRVEIDHVNVVAPSLLIEYNESGESNLENLMRESEDSPAVDPLPSDESGPQLGVDRVVITDGSVLRRDHENRSYLTVTGIALDATFPNLEDIAKHIGFAATMEFDSLHVRQETDTSTSNWILSSGEPHAYTEGHWDRVQSRVQIDSLLVGWWGTQISVRGTAESFPSVTEVRINARMAKTNLEKFVEQFQQVYPPANEWTIDGQAEGSMEGIFLWPQPEGSVPEWHMTLMLTELDWRMTEPNITLSLPQFELRGDGQTLSWSGVNGHVGEGTFSFNGSIDRLFSDDRTISARVQGSTPLALVKAIAPEAVDGELEGTVSADLTVFGRFDQWRRWRIAGDLAANPLIMRDPSWTFDSLRVVANVNSDGSRATLKKCDWIAGRSIGHATGSIENVQALMSLVDENPDVPRGQLDIVSSFLDLDEFIGESEEQSTSGDTLTDEENPMPAFTLSGKLSADSALYTKLVFRDLQSDYKYSNDVLTLDPIRGRVLSGRLRGSLIWDINNWAKPEFTTTVRADSIQANDFLSRYFGWAGGVFGAVSLEGTFGGAGRDALQILPTLTALGRAQLEGGRIESAPLLAGIANKVNVPTLAQPHTLRDARIPFRIENGRVITDPLTFATPDAKFRCIGSFGFDRSLQYDVAVSPLKELGALGKADFNLGVSGTVSNPVVRLDAAKTGKQVIDNLIDKAVDSVKTKTVDKLLDKLKQPKKP